MRHPVLPVRMELGLLHGLFFLSGFSALVYQVVWQRVLFSITGVDLIATTVVITTFMVGLGCGALWGGGLADRFIRSRALVFALTELGIGLYGIFSLKLMSWLAEMVSGQHDVFGFLAVFAVLLFPTILMGTTLPVLITYFCEVRSNVGINTGALYRTNTLGAAFGALITGFFLIASYGLSGSVHTAAAMNCFAGLSVLFLYIARNKP